MKRLDLSHNRRIPILLDLMRSMHRFNDPRELLETFVRTLRRVYGSRCFLQIDTEGLRPGEYRVVRMRTHDDFELFKLGAPPLLLRGGVLAEAIADGPKILHELELGNDPAMGSKLAAYRSLTATPILSSALGMSWLVLLDPGPDTFTERDLEELILRGGLVGSMVSNLEIARKLAEANAQIQSEIDAIGRIQKALLPQRLPEIPGLKIAVSYRTFDRAGGDLYDVARLDDRMVSWNSDDDARWAFLIGDVSGHGPAAAVVMAMFHAILHTYPLKPNGPAEMLRHVNRHLCATTIEHSFVTAFLAFYDPKTRQLMYSRAGHNPPLLKDFPHRGPPTHLGAVGELPLGILPDVEYSEATITLHPGQTLILYTDGVTEAKRREAELFGVEGIERSLIACTGAPECAIKHINEALMAYQAEVRPNDDQTIVAIQVV